ncbi:hypothetical protein JZ751_028694, partial [Albula glossodonta]
MLPSAFAIVSTALKRRMLTSFALKRLYCSHGPGSSDSASGVRVLYDGECPICVKEIRFLQYLQKNRPGKVHFVDISVPGYDGTKYGGIDYDMAMEEMHVHRGVPAFTVMYTAVGLGWLGNFMSWPLVRPVMDKAYSVFARNRLKWTGRDPCVTGRWGEDKVPHVQISEFPNERFVPIEIISVKRLAPLSQDHMRSFYRTSQTPFSEAFGQAALSVHPELNQATLRVVGPADGVPVTLLMRHSRERDVGLVQARLVLTSLQDQIQTVAVPVVNCAHGEEGLLPDAEFREEAQANGRRVDVFFDGDLYKGVVASEFFLSGRQRQRQRRQRRQRTSLGELAFITLPAPGCYGNRA